jgi:hypothetical protein
MTKVLSIATLFALPVMLAAGPSHAQAASPAPYCTFTSPASKVCPTDILPPVRVAANRVTVDHCVLATPASTACPAGSAATQGVAANKAAQVVVSRN